MTLSIKHIIVGVASACLFSSACLASDFLADRHGTRGVTCESCHGTKAPQPGAKVETAKCNTCHGSLDKVAELTKAKKLDPDPHYNHLVGLDCNECHKGHQPSVNMCSNCHNIKFKVP